MLGWMDTWVMWRRPAGQEGSCSFIRRLRTPAVCREVIQICRESRKEKKKTVRMKDRGRRLSHSHPNFRVAALLMTVPQRLIAKH